MSNKGLVFVLIGLILGWNLVGAVSLGMKQETLDGRVGEVWNQIDRAEQLLPRLESQMLVAYADRQELQDKISAARSDILAARESGGMAELETAMSSTSLTLRAFSEAQPADLSPLQTGLLDETAGTLNRITYARSKLIEAQAGFNKTRIVFFPAGLLFQRQQVLGGNSNPAAQLSPSKIGQ